MKSHDDVAKRSMASIASAIAAVLIAPACAAETPHCVRVTGYELQGSIHAGDPQAVSIARPEPGIFELKSPDAAAATRRVLLSDGDRWGPIDAVDGAASLLRFSQGTSLLANAAVIDDDAPDLAIHDASGPLLDLSREYNVPFSIRERTASGVCREPVPQSHPEVMSAVYAINTDDGIVDVESGQKVQINVNGRAFEVICLACATDFALFFTMRVDGV